MCQNRGHRWTKAVIVTLKPYLSGDLLFFLSEYAIGSHISIAIPSIANRMDRRIEEALEPVMKLDRRGVPKKHWSHLLQVFFCPQKDPEKYVFQNIVTVSTLSIFLDVPLKSVLNPIPSALVNPDSIPIKSLLNQS